MRGIEWPTVDEIAADLILIRNTQPKVSGEDGWIDVRLQVMEDGDWSIHSGDSQYDTDHGGFWGCDSLNYQSDCREVAESLLEEAQDQYYIHAE